MTYSNCAKITEPAASAARSISLTANRLSAYCGYQIGKYIKMHWKTTKAPGAKVVMPTTLEMEVMSSCEVQAKVKSPIDSKFEATMAGTGLCS